MKLSFSSVRNFDNNKYPEKICLAKMVTNT